MNNPSKEIASRSRPLFEDVTSVTYKGKTFQFGHSNPKDHIFSHMQSEQRFYESTLLERLESLVQPGQLVIDVGANIGNHAIFFAGVCGCKVIAIEPNPAAIAILRHNISLNGLDDLIDVAPYAAGAAAKNVSLVEAQINNLGMASIEQTVAGAIEMRSLDEIVAGRGPVSLIKIDVEHMELDVLVGAQNTISADKPSISVELDSADVYTEFVSIIMKHNYIPIGSFNYTPTHLFVVEDKIPNQYYIIRDLDHKISLQYIEQMRRFKYVDNRISYIRNKIDYYEKKEKQWVKSSDLKELFRYHIEQLKGNILDLGTYVDNLSEKIQVAVEAQSLAASEQEKLTSELAQRLNYSHEIAGLSRKIDMALEAQLLTTAAHEEVVSALEHRLANTLQRQISEQVRRHLEEAVAQLRSDMTVAVGRTVAEREVFDDLAVSDSDAEPLDTLLKRLNIPRDVPASALIPSISKQAIYEKTGDTWLVHGGDDADKPKTPAETLAHFNFAETWSERGWPKGGAILQDGGVVATDSVTSHLGFVSASFDCSGGGLIEVEVDSKVISDTKKSLYLRLGSDEDTRLGCDANLENGKSIVRVFAPARTKTCRFYIQMDDAEAGAAFLVRSASVRRLTASQHQKDVRARVGAPVIASMATIPKRREMLRDCVASLLTQCDLVRVFLNNYEDVPDFLDHPRVEWRRSQDWDDRGDAGKFFWIDKEDAETGYRLIVDDDLIFPPDFVDVMTGKVKASGNRAIYATHGVLLRQPFERYYDLDARAETFHFGNPVAEDRGVHIGATNAMCMPAGLVKMRWDDFRYCNSADVWISLYAQKHKIPVLTPERPRHWVAENRHPEGGETIYDHALKRTRTRFDSSLVQDAVLRHAGPLTLTPLNRAKLGFAVEINSPADLVEIADIWPSLRSGAVEWVIMLLFDFKDAALASEISSISLAHETHKIDTSETCPPLQEAAELHCSLGLAATLFAQADCTLKKPDIGDPKPLSPDIGLKLGDFIVAPWRDAETSAYCAASFGAKAEGLETLKAALSQIRLFKRPADASNARAPFSIADFETLGSGPADVPPPADKKDRLITVGDVFERVQVINLDRRPDRWAAAVAQLEHFGVQASRFSAVDGKDPIIAEQFEAYAKSPLRRVSEELPSIESSADFYMRYVSQNARIAHLESSSGKKAIESAGAWGYLRSFEALIEDALTDQVETLLVFDDDIRLHKDFSTLFDQAMRQLPDDWLIVQLGSLQYEWREPWMTWRTPLLYQTSGVAIGSHAVGMKFEVLPCLLDHTKRMDLPFDTGALSATIRAFPDRCFVIHPNLAIQSIKDSDIGTSGFQMSHTAEEIAETYRWRLSDYGVDAPSPA